MEAVLSRLRGLSDDELRQELARADIKVGPITATTRAIFERKLARVLAGPESAGGPAPQTDDPSGSSGDQSDPAVVTCSGALGSTAAAAAACEEADFGYGSGLNPPEEEDILGAPRAETPSKAAQVLPSVFYGVCPLWEDVLTRNERPHVYTDKKDALQVVKMMKGARFKAFPTREDAEKFAKGMCDYYPSPSKSTSCGPDLTAKLRKAVEKGDETTFYELIWNNPRYLIGSGDNPVVVQEGCRYNVMHVAAKENQAGIVQLLLDTLENPDFMRLMYPDDQEHMLQRRIRYIGFETPLHFACKFGCPDVVNILCSHPDVDKNRKNKYNQKPCEVIYRCYIPLLRATDNSSQPIIGGPWSPEPSESFSHSMSPRHARSPMEPRMTVKAFAGPLSPSKAEDFRRAWKTPPRERAEFHQILKSDPERGVERVGRSLAHERGHPWSEYWDFLDSFVDLSSVEGLRKLEDYLSSKDSSQRAHQEAGENETSNRFRTPSPGKPKKFCNSVSVGAFLDEGDDISLEEMKNRQNAARTSIGSVAGVRDRRGADLIETAAEVDLLSPDAEACGTELCASSVSGGSARGGTPNGDKVSATSSSPRVSPSSSALLLSPVSNLTLEFEHMSLGDATPAGSGGGGVRERRSSGGSRHRELRDSSSSSSSSSPGVPVATAQLSAGLGRLSLGHPGHEEEEAAQQEEEEFASSLGAAWRAEDEGAVVVAAAAAAWVNLCCSSSSEEFLEALDVPPAQRTRGADSGRTFCARSKSWDHGGRDLSSSGSSASYKSFNSSNEFLSRTPPPPPRTRRGLFIEGDLPTKLDSDVLEAIEDINTQQYPSIHKWRNTMRSYSKSDMLSWPSPAVVRHRPTMPPHTPGSPAGRFSPARHTPSAPDFSPGRYSPAHISSMQRIRLKHFNTPPL
ncbi:hypothetical protein CRUP_011818 [Coryphaenoides rupestris]|nr:hypothetical protein CRUP_011818 [Coryphaenoides rupestris]